MFGARPRGSAGGCRTRAARRPSARACGRDGASSRRPRHPTHRGPVGRRRRWVEDTHGRADGRRHRVAAGGRELLLAVREAGLATALVTTTPRRLGRHRAAVDPGGSRRGSVRRHDLRRRGAGAQAGPGAVPPGDADLGVDAGECVVDRGLAGRVTAGLAAGAAVLGVPSSSRDGLARADPPRLSGGRRPCGAADVLAEAPTGWSPPRPDPVRRLAAPPRDRGTARGRRRATP